MSGLFKIQMVLSLFLLFIGCGKKQNLHDEIKLQFYVGNFIKAKDLINQVRREKKDSVFTEYEILKAKMERIELDFSKTETEIIEGLRVWFPDINADQMRKWESDKSLEMKIINGQRRYFKNALPNLFRISKEAKKIKEQKTGIQPDRLDSFRLVNTAQILTELNNNTGNRTKFTIKYSIKLKPDAVPAGETVRCWLPFPRESFPRQTNVVLTETNAENYILSTNENLQRSLYIERTVKDGESLTFIYSATFETAPLYFRLEKEKIKPYNTLSLLYREYTKERPPHIIFTEPVKKLALELTAGLTSPVDKTKAIFYWIDQNIPWASALEYSTMDCIPDYVLANRHGDCGMKTFLFMSMARYAGIPCKWQSGWMLHPDEINLHDWCEVYYEGYGWVPLDQSFGLQQSDNAALREFYFSGIDEFRMIVNDDFACEFNPKKNYYRSEPFDFQRGELEWKGGNLYFDKWSYNLEITSEKIKQNQIVN